MPTIKDLCRCDSGCGNGGAVFVSNGSAFFGHYCANQKRWTNQPLPSLDWEDIYKRYVEAQVLLQETGKLVIKFEPPPGSAAP